jgi:hypothetical protein
MYLSPQHPPSAQAEKEIERRAWTGSALQSVVSVTMREEDGNELEYQDELVSGDQTARLIRRDEQQ